MIRKFIKKNNMEEENIFWVTMSDMLLGLMMVFMILFVLTITGFSQSKFKQQETQSQVAQELIEKMKAQNINVEIDKVTGEVKISDLELFDINSYTLSPNGKKYLSKFIPIYINTIFSNPKLSNKIVNIVIQGHTDSQMFKNTPSRELQFTKNMDLSIKRADAVENYIFQTGYNKKYTDNLIHILTVEGKSYTDPIIVNGKEDYAKSRRVELKLVVKDANLQDFLTKNKFKIK